MRRVGDSAVVESCTVEALRTSCVKIQHHPEHLRAAVAKWCLRSNVVTDVESTSMTVEIEQVHVCFALVAARVVPVPDVRGV